MCCVACQKHLREEYTQSLQNRGPLDHTRELMRAKGNVPLCVHCTAPVDALQLVAAQCD